jgi:diguanylate cyclase (GGDEF)-like protein/PAS domain S-box-containing protein
VTDDNDATIAVSDGFALEAVLTAVEHGIVVVDGAGELLLANAAADRLLGPALPWLLGRRMTAARITLAANQRPARAGDLPLGRALRGEAAESVEIVLTPRRGEPPRWLELSATGLADGGAVLTVRDVTADQQSRAAAREAEERFRLTFEGAPVGIALVSTDAGQGRLLQVNAAFCTLAGRPLDELLELRLSDLVRPLRADQDAARRLLSGESRVATEQVRFIRPDGSSVWVQLHAALTRGVDHRSTQAIVQAEDFDVRRRYEDRLRHLADHDALTGLFNRRRFSEELAAHTERCLRYGPEGVLVLFDLDGFKDVNDTLGHAAGDQILIGAAGVLGTRLRTTDTLARLGGDEFAVLLPRITVAEGAEVAREVIQLLTHNAASGLSGQTRISATAGLATFDGEPLGDRDVLTEADIALYEAKRGDRGGVAVFRPSERRDFVARTTMTDLIRRALRDGGFALHCQPIFDFAAGKVNRHELLLRLEADDGELIPPERFIPVAEQIGAIRAIDRWVFSEAVELLRKHPYTGELMVNVSAISLTDAQFAIDLAGLVQGSDIDPSRLTLEVTETAAIAHMEGALDLARQLRSVGCKLALDDFGAGFASFYHLKRLPFDVLKIDGEFVRDAVDDATSRAIISAVVQTAATINSATVAECVENEATFELARELGVGAAQGFFVGHPRPLDTLAD